jgi:3-phenylpropionate/trans-cinnamate dioxygenase ferredoxin subunit
VPPGFERVARLDDVPTGTLLAVRTAGGEEVCLANHDGDVYAVQDRCTHQAFPLSVGELLADGTIQCAWHGARFDGETGCACEGPATEPVPVYEVLVLDDDIYVKVATR